MKRISAAKNACVALAGLAAAAALAYAAAFVVWAPVKRVENYAALAQKFERPYVVPGVPYLREQVATVWTAFPPVPEVIIPEPPHFSLAGTTVSPDPKCSRAVVNTPSGQSIVRIGDRLMSARFDAIAAGSATFNFLGKPFPLKINRFDK